MHAYALGLYEKSMPNALSISEKLQHAKAAGFDYLELSIDETPEKLARLDWSPTQLQQLVQDQQRLGLSIRSICLSGHRSFPMGHPEECVRAQSQLILQKAVDLAVALGVRMIQLAGYDVYYQPSTPQTVAFFAQGLRQATDYAASRGVILGFETMETPFMDTVAKALVWVETIQSPFLQIYPDVGNLTNAALCYGHDVLADLALGQGHLVAVHLKETRPNVFREVPFGAGHVNFPPLTQLAIKAGVRMFVGEFWYTGQENWLQILKENYNFLCRALD